METIKTTAFLFLSLAILLLIPGTLSAQNSYTLTVEDPVGLTLAEVSHAGATDYETVAVRSDFTFEHDSDTNQKISAQTQEATIGIDGNDVTLKVQIYDNQTNAVGTEGTLVDNGGTTAEQELWSEISSGEYNYEIEWTADATLAETTAGGIYEWEVTFTATDDT